jgi:hypothetical protein
VYFAKKFLELDLLTDVCVTFEEAAKALFEHPDAYGLILIGCPFLLKSGLELALEAVFPSTVDKSAYMIVVYELQEDGHHLVAELARHGVDDILVEPYTAASLAVRTSACRQTVPHLLSRLRSEPLGVLSSASAVLADVLQKART